MSKKQIALIDDSSPFRLLIRQILEDRFDIDEFQTADEFLSNMSRASRYDLIILDIHLPGTDGLEALGILQDHEAASGIPTLLLTGDSRKDTVVRGRKLGASDYLIKPIDPFQVEKRVAALLGEDANEDAG